MGSGAFLMVAFTEQKYIAIVIAAVIPAAALLLGLRCRRYVPRRHAHITLHNLKDTSSPKSREVMKALLDLTCSSSGP